MSKARRYYDALDAQADALIAQAEGRKVTTTFASDGDSLVHVLKVGSKPRAPKQDTRVAVEVNEHDMMRRLRADFERGVRAGVRNRWTGR